MKVVKLISALFAASAVVLSGCGKKDNTEKEFLIVTSFYPVYIIALNVADGTENVKIVNMTPPYTGCLHDYSVTAKDIKNLEDAGILLINGAGMESFLDKIAAKYPGLKTAELSEGIPLIKDEKGENPHIWVSVSNAIMMTENCLKILSAADPVHADQYRKNAEKYIKELNNLKTGMKTKLDKYRGKKVVTFHEAFPYFAKEFNLEIAAVVEREPGSEPSAKELAGTITLVRKSGIKTLFAEPQYPSASAETIARETGAKLFILDPAVTGDDEKNAYIKIMKNNLSVLVRAFSEK